MKYTHHILTLCILALFPAQAAEYRWLHDGEHATRAEVVRRDADRIRGLMYRPWLAPVSGMLFVFTPPQPVSFWMKNTLIPLEIRLYDATGKLVTRHSAIPCTHSPCVHYPARGNVSYVLETRARYQFIPPRHSLTIRPY